jgi:hypothetical protein
MTFESQKLCGWAGREQAARAWGELGHRFGEFRIVGDLGPTQGVRLLLWDFAKKVTGGHLPNYRQEIGDCVSFGAKNAVQYLTCVQIAQGQRDEYHHAFPPFIYGTSRHDIGGDRLGGSDGSLGVWAAEAVKKFGVLFADDSAVPSYSSQVASQWGSRSGPPREFYDVARDNPVRSCAKVTTYAQVRDALANGYPVTVASNQGFAMEGRQSDDKCWGVPQGSWAHQMCFIGVDDDSSRPGCFCLNSWGKDLWPIHPDGAPPGGFWVDARIVERMVGQDDSFAYSQFEGFPAQKLDHLLL